MRSIFKIDKFPRHGAPNQLQLGIVVVTVFVLSLIVFLRPTPTQAAQTDLPCFDSACITTGTQLLTVDSTQSELLDAILGDLLGTDVQLTAGNWQGLAQGSVQIDELFEQLQLDLGVATPEEVLTTDLTLGEFVDSIITVLEADGDVLTVDALEDLQLDLTDLTDTVQLGDLLDLDLTDGALSTADLNLLDLLTGSIQLFNYDNILTTPEPILISGSDLGLEGILNEISLQAQVIEPPTIVCGQADTEFYSAAIRLKLSLDLIDTDLDVVDLDNLLDNLLGALITVDVEAAVGQLDVYAAIGRGQGTIELIDNVTKAVTVDATPGAVDLYVGSMDDSDFFNRDHVIEPATDLQFGNIGTLAVVVESTVLTLLDVDLAIQARSFAEGESPSSQTLNFAAPYPKTQTVSTNADFASNLVDDLVNNLELQISGSLGNLLDPLVNDTILPALRDLTNEVLTPILTPLLDDLVQPLLDGLGLGLGEMTVTVNGTIEACAGDGDDDGDTVTNDDEDTNNNGNPDDDDTDNDGDPDYQDPDDDNDTVPTKDEDPNNNGNPQDDDTDNDGTPNYHDPDDDNDTVPTKDEDPNNNGNPQDDDTDNDGTPNYLDPDDDGDTVPTRDEDVNNNGNPQDDDTDNDGIPNYLDPDDDGDTVPTKEEDVNKNGNPQDDDTDNDGTPNYLDTDDDNDTVPTKDEDPNGNGNPQDDDTDADNLRNYLDDNDDNDNLITRLEDPNNNGDPQDDDSDNDGLADYLDIDSPGTDRATSEILYLPIIQQDIRN